MVDNRKPLELRDNERAELYPEWMECARRLNTEYRRYAEERLTVTDAATVQLESAAAILRPSLGEAHARRWAASYLAGLMVDSGAQSVEATGATDYERIRELWRAIEATPPSYYEDSGSDDDK